MITDFLGLLTSPEKHGQFWLSILKTRLPFFIIEIETFRKPTSECKQGSYELVYCWYSQGIRASNFSSKLKALRQGLFWQRIFARNVRYRVMYINNPLAVQLKLWYFDLFFSTQRLFPIKKYTLKLSILIGWLQCCFMN